MLFLLLGCDWIDVVVSVVFEKFERREERLEKIGKYVRYFSGFGSDVIRCTNEGTLFGSSRFGLSEVLPDVFTFRGFMKHQPISVKVKVKEALYYETSC